MTGGSKRVSLIVNGSAVSGEAEPRRSLADFLREDLGLVGTHLGCEHGVCGACTVLVGEDAVRSCLIFAVQADGAEVTTVEALGTTGHLGPLQEAFRDAGGLQCGFCTPGMLMSAYAFVQGRSEATEEEIREAIAGNLCRCTGYESIVRAIGRALHPREDA
jgi:carbon-monoxide dehydrogenase small subunit